MLEQLVQPIRAADKAAILRAVAMLRAGLDKQNAEAQSAYGACLERRSIGSDSQIRSVLKPPHADLILRSATERAASLRAGGSRECSRLRNVGSF